MGWSRGSAANDSTNILKGGWEGWGVGAIHPQKDGRADQ